MKVGFNAAAAAYANTLRRAQPGAGEAAAGGFQELVKQAAASSIDTVKAGKAATMKAVTGKADMTQVVTAVSNAEVTLQAAVAVRDKVIQAYLDVIRMPI